MFVLLLLQPGIRVRTGGAQRARHPLAAVVPALVAAQVFAAYWFT